MAVDGVESSTLDKDFVQPTQRAHHQYSAPYSTWSPSTRYIPRPPPRNIERIDNAPNAIHSFSQSKLH